MTDGYLHDIAGLIVAAKAGLGDAYLKQARRDLDDGGWQSLIDQGVDAHRQGDLELVDLLAGSADTRIGYSTQQFVEKATASADLSLEGLLAVVAAAALRLKGEVPYWMMNATERWCERNVDNPMRLFETIRDGRAPAGLLHVALATGFKQKRSSFLPIITGMLAAGDAVQRSTAARVLAQVPDYAPADLALAVNALQRALRAARGDEVEPPLRALLDIAVSNPASTSVGLAALREVSTRADTHVRAAVVNSMTFGAARAHVALARAALALLHDAGGGETATLESIDFVLSENLGGPIADSADALADHLLTKETVTMKQLDSFESKLLTSDDGTLVRTVTRWLVTDIVPLHLAVRDVCMSVDGTPLTFDLDFSGAFLTPERAVSIARRSCGVLLLVPEAAASIIVSLMKTGPADAIPALADLLWDPILISYWSGPRTYLEAVLPALPTAVAEVVTRVIARLDEYAAAIEKVRNLPELRPSPHHRHLAAIRRHKEQLAIQKAAQAQSPIASLFPTSIMLFGDSSVYEMEIEPGKSVRQESVLGVHEYSQELPRLDVIDPFGTWYKRMMLIKDGDDE